jgi:hypothetical protein
MVFSSQIEEAGGIDGGRPAMTVADNNVLRVRG